MIGQLIEKNSKTGKTFTGHISTLAANLYVELSPAIKSDNPNSPSYRVYARGHAGSLVQVGAAWVKIVKRGGNIGEEFITITIDDPSLPRPLNVAAFKNAATGVWEVMFRRRQEKSS